MGSGPPEGDRKRVDAARREPTAPSPEPDAEAEGRRRAARVALAFASLPEANREVLLLSVVEGVPTGDVAKILGLREEAVRKRLSRAPRPSSARPARPP